MPGRVWKKILPVFTAGMLLWGCSNAELANATFVRELGEDIYGNPALYLKDGEDADTSGMSVQAVTPGITIKDNRFVTTGMDVLGVGEYDFVLVQGSSQTPFVIKVKDTKAPVVQKSPDCIEVSLYESIDWSEVFDARDLSGVYYEAPAGITAQSGEQSVDVTIRDRFGNSTVKTITVAVS
jgi:hypothetical protein